MWRSERKQMSLGCDGGTAQGTERAAGAHRRAFELGPNRAVAERGLRGGRRPSGVPAAADVARAAAAAMVHAVGPGAGRGALRSAELSPLRGIEPGRGSARPFDA